MPPEESLILSENSGLVSGDFKPKYKTIDDNIVTGKQIGRAHV